MGKMCTHVQDVMCVCVCVRVCERERERGGGVKEEKDKTIVNISETVFTPVKIRILHKRTAKPYVIAAFKLGINLSTASISKNVGASPAPPATVTNDMISLESH